MNPPHNLRNKTRHKVETIRTLCAPFPVTTSWLPPEGYLSGTAVTPPWGSTPSLQMHMPLSAHSVVLPFENKSTVSCYCAFSFSWGCFSSVQPRRPMSLCLSSCCALLCRRRVYVHSPIHGLSLVSWFLLPKIAWQYIFFVCVSLYVRACDGPLTAWKHLDNLVSFHTHTPQTSFHSRVT